MAALILRNPAPQHITALPQQKTTIVRANGLSMLSASASSSACGRAMKLSRRRHMATSASHHHCGDSSSQDPIMSSSSSSPADCLNMKRSIQSGEKIVHHGSIVVIGNVESGAVIHAVGNVIVLGSIEGEIHAGTNGDKNPIIFAWKLRPQSLSIDGCAAGESVQNSQFGVIASLLGGKIRLQTIIDDDRQATTPHSWFAINKKSVKKASKVALFTGGYIFLVGLALLAFPESLFGMFFDLTRRIDEWIRVGAVLAIVFGVYYIGTAWGYLKGFDGAQSFYMSTVVGRIFLFLSFSLLAVTGAAPFPVFIIGVVNFLGALSMLYALQKPETS